MSSDGSYTSFLQRMNTRALDTETTSSEDGVTSPKAYPLVPINYPTYCYMNLNQNANTSEEESTSKGARRKKKRKTANTEPPTFKCDLFSYSTLVGPQIPDDCTDKEFCEGILMGNTTTVYKLPALKRKLHTRRVKYIPAVVMVQCTIDRNAGQVTTTLADGTEIECMLPTGPNAVEKATEKVLNSEANAAKKIVFDTYPFLPYNRDLPKIEIQNHEYGKWRKHTPVQVTLENLIIFMYAPTNIRFGALTYAANCRHPMGHWDEHPWCPLCVLKANIEPCLQVENCYICNRMGPAATKARKSKIKYWKNRLRKEPDIDYSRSNIPCSVSTQLHSDYYNKSADDEANPDWELGYFGFCRPGWLVPIYYSWKDFYISLTTNITLTDTIKQHLDEFKEEYERLKPRKKNALWSPLPKPTLHTETTKRKRKGEGIYTEEDEDDDYNEYSNSEDDYNSDQQDTNNDNYNIYPTTAPYQVWQAKGRFVTCIAPDNTKKRSPEDAIQAAARVRRDTLDTVLPDVLHIEDAIFNDLEVKPTSVYPVNQRMSTYVDKTLDCYSANCYDPDLPTHLPVSYANFQDDGKIQCYARVCQETTEGNLPYDHNTVRVSQREATALDTLNRANVKVNEIDAYIMPALLKYTENLESQRTPEEKATGTLDITKMVNQLRYNFVQREKLIGMSTGITVAIRRRDNAEQHQVTGDDLNVLVARPLDDRGGGGTLM